MISVMFFAVCAGILLYVTVGYPLLLAWMAPKFELPVIKRRIQPPVSIIIVVYNGAQYIEAKLKSVLGLNYPAELLDVLVVSDGSTDDTDAIVERYADRGVRLMTVPRGGKPAGLNAGIPATKGEILVLTDVRQDLEPDSVQYLIDCFADPKVGVVSGDLLIRHGKREDQQDVGRYWDYERAMRKNLSRIDSIFGATGPFYAIRKSLTVRIPPHMLLDDVYLPLAVYFRGYRLIVEEKARAYDYPTTLGTEFNRKVRTLGGNYQILQQYPALLTPRNRMWPHFVSYKLGRLLLPWTLMGIGIASLFLPGWLGTFALVVQAVIYGMALLDGLMPAGFPLKKLTSPARTFVTLNLAAVFALKVFFVQPQQMWKVTSTGKKLT